MCNVDSCWNWLINEFKFLAKSPSWFAIVFCRVFGGCVRACGRVVSGYLWYMVRGFRTPICLSGVGVRFLISGGVQLTFPIACCKGWVGLCCWLHIIWFTSCRVDPCLIISLICCAGPCGWFQGGSFLCCGCCTELSLWRSLLCWRFKGCSTVNCFNLSSKFCKTFFLLSLRYFNLSSSNCLSLSESE